MKILFAGGGTAGHLFPIIAVARELKKKQTGKDISFFYLGPKDDFAQELLSPEGIKVHIISGGKIRRYFNFVSFFQNAVDLIFKVPLGFLQALYYVFVISPDLIFSKGGYGSLPTVVSGWLLLTPVFLHESDVVPGLANRILSRFCLEIFVSFPLGKTEYFKPHKMISVGNPIRSEVLEGEIGAAKEVLNLKGDRPVILVLGGSQGSERINDVIMDILPDLLTNFELIHQVGAKNIKEIEAEAKIILSLNTQASEASAESKKRFISSNAAEELKERYHIYPFLSENELKTALQAARLIVSRAGSGTIFELAALGKPSLLVPLPESAQNHQLKNAYAFAENGACLVLEEANLTPHFFLERIKYLFDNPEKLELMSKNARTFAKPLSAKIIAGYIVEYLSQ